MYNKDILQRFLFENVSVRGELVHLDTTMQTILNQHDYPPILKKLLAEALVVTTMLTATIKFKGRLTLQFQGSGKIKLLLVQGNHDLQLRGLIQWEGDITDAELIQELKKGTLGITVDPDNNVSGRYQGIISFEGNSLAQSVEAYFRYSEQLPTRLWVAVDDEKAAGLMLQVLPNALESQQHEEDWNRLTILTETLKPEELLSLEQKNLLFRLFSEEDVRIFAPDPVIFRCNCSVQRGENAILMLGREEAEEELQAKQNIVVTCEFCNKEYVFNRNDVDAMFKKQDKPTLH